MKFNSNNFQLLIIGCLILIISSVSAIGYSHVKENSNYLDNLSLKNPILAKESLYTNNGLNNTFCPTLIILNPPNL